MPNETEKVSLFSRGECGPYGKYTVEVKTHLDEPTHYLWLQHCAKKNVNAGQFMREILYKILRGKTPSQIVAEDSEDRCKALDDTGLIEGGDQDGGTPA